MRGPTARGRVDVNDMAVVLRSMNDPDHERLPKFALRCSFGDVEEVENIRVFR